MSALEARPLPAQRKFCIPAEGPPPRDQERMFALLEQMYAVSLAARTERKVAPSFAHGVQLCADLGQWSWKTACEGQCERDTVTRTLPECAVM